MDRLLGRWWWLLERIGRVESAIGVGLVVLIVVSITVQVFTRYVFGEPLVWVEELAGYCFLWAVFIGAAAGTKQMRQLRIETFVGRLRPRARAFWRCVAWVVASVVMLTVAWQAWDIMEVESRSRTISLPVDLPRHLFYSVPLFTSALSIAFTTVYLVLAEWAAMTRDRPVDAETARVAREARDRAEDGWDEARLMTAPADPVTPGERNSR
jgi:TRAP-type C4-dicarboxylate transport system permease small subunit